MSSNAPGAGDVDIRSLSSDLRLAAIQLEGKELDEEKSELLRAASHLVTVLEQPGDRMARLAKAPVGHAVLRTAIDVGLFEHFQPGINSAQALADRCGVDSILLARLLKVLVTHGIFEQDGPEGYKHTRASRDMTLPGFRAVIRGFAETAEIMPQLPGYLASIRYENPGDEKPGFFGFAKGTNLGMFEWLEQHPDKLQVFQDFQTEKGQMLDKGFESLLRELIESKLAAKRSSGHERPVCRQHAVLLCDVGGGRGTALRNVSTSTSELSRYGRTVTQDLASVVQGAQSCLEWEAMPHDFFTAQPIKGADIYLMRDVLHNWSDAACCTILGNIVEAMGSESQIIILDAVLPEAGASQLMTYIDIQMMQFGGMERTESQWRELLGKVGLKMENIEVRNPTGFQSMIRSVKM